MGDWHRQRYIEDLNREIVGCERRLEDMKTRAGLEGTSAVELAEQALANAQNALKQVTPKKAAPKKAGPEEQTKPAKE